MKRPLFHRICSLWLALLVLTSSVGLTVQQHTCRQSGRHTAGVVFRPVRHGCPAPQTTAPHASKARFTKACCEFGAHFHKLDAPSAKRNWVQAPLPASLSIWPAVPAWGAGPWAQVAAPAAWHAADSSPPLRAGRALLTFVGVLIV